MNQSRGNAQLKKFIKSFYTNFNWLLGSNILSITFVTLCTILLSVAVKIMWELQYGPLILIGIYLLVFAFTIVLSMRNISQENNGAGRYVQRITKRILDLSITIPCLIFLTPTIVFIMIMIKLDTPGPSIYKVNRIGLYGRLITVYKFRTMKIKDEKRSTSRKEDDIDLYISTVGKLVRRLYLDTLPQLFNVLIGEMSMVGPYPYHPKQLELLKPDQLRVFSLPPGITGLWQISNTQNYDFDTKVKMDLEYVDKWSLIRDIQILVKTTGAVFHHRSES